VQRRTRREENEEYFGRPLLVEAEQLRLLQALFLGHGDTADHPSPEALVQEAVQLVDWAREVRLEVAMLAAALRGEALVRWQDNRPQCKHPLFSQLETEEEE